MRLVLCQSLIGPLIEKAVLQALCDKSPAGRDAVWGRYIVKIDAEIDQRQAEVLQDIRDITEKSWTAEERRK